MARNPLPFRYPGGKFYAMDILQPFWESIEHDEYREPFAGGATVFFHKPKVTFNWLNDMDAELISTYEAMQDITTRNRLVDELSTEVASKERWREVYESEPQNDFEVAKKYYYMNRTSFSGKLVSPAWGYRPKRSLPPERWRERIVPCGAYLQDVKLTNNDFENVILENAKGNTVLMYVDPPYYGPPKHKHYRFGFDVEDHVRLAEVLKKTTHKFFLTYDDVPEIRELYSWAQIYEVNFIYRVDNSVIRDGQIKLGFELIITNFKVAKNQTLFD